MDNLLREFKVIVEHPLAWGEMDSHLHVNNIWFFRYIENARIAYYERIGKFEFERASGVSFMLASSSCEFISPLFYPDTVLVGAGIEEILFDRAIMNYRLVSKKYRRLAATARATLVSFCYSDNKKTAFPSELKERISILEGKPY